MAGQKAPQSCPKCGGDMWDNIEGKRNPKAPDYACKDKQGCGAGVWLTPEEKSALRPASNNGTTGGSSKPAGGLILDAIMYRCHESAVAIHGKLYGSETLSESIAATAHSLFIARCRGEGILKMEKPKAVAAPPAPPPPPPPPPALEPEYVGVDLDDGLPF